MYMLAGNYLNGWFVFEVMGLTTGSFVLYIVAFFFFVVCACRTHKKLKLISDFIHTILLRLFDFDVRLD